MTRAAAPSCGRATARRHGTVLVKDIYPGAQQLDPSEPRRTSTARCSSRPTTPTSGRELWRSDGTAAGTVLVKDIIPGLGQLDPGDLTQRRRDAVLPADDGASGSELWKSDGTAAGTVLVKDINPGGGTLEPVATSRT